MTKKIKVILQKSFDFNLNELTGETIDEKTENAINIARARLNSSLTNKTSKALLEERVVIYKSNERTKSFV